MTPSSLQQLLRDRHSCRAFRPDPVPRDTIEAIFALAQQAASWCNSQPWQVTVVSGRALEELRALLLDTFDRNATPQSDLPFPAEYRGVYKDRRFESAMRLYGAVGVARGDRAASAAQTRENFRLFGAPNLAVLTTEPGLGVYGAVDVGGYLQVLMLAMQAYGVATIAQAALATQSGLLKQVLGIPPERMVVCGLSFGYEDTAHVANAFRTARAPLHEVLSWRQ